jgi:hypothetical protein
MLVMATWRITLEVPDAKMAARRADWRLPLLHFARDFGLLHSQQKRQANEGCDYTVLKSTVLTQSRRLTSNAFTGENVYVQQRIIAMRLSIAMFAACLLSGAAWAQSEKPSQKVWTAAPVPGNLPSNVSPADRAGNNTGPDASSPFSSVPPGARLDSRPNDITRDGGGPGTDSVTPNLSR